MFLVLFLFTFVHSRIYEQTFTNSAFKREKGWVYLSKMVLGPGQSKIDFVTTVKGTINQTIDVEFSIINEQNFIAESRYKCDNSHHKSAVSKLHSFLPNNLPYHSTATLSLTDKQIFHFVLRDCKRQIGSNDLLKTIVVSAKLTIVNNESHLGSDEDGWTVYPILMVIYLLLIWKIYRQKPLEGDKNWLQFILMLGLIGRFIGVFWKWLGVFIYQKTGNNYMIFQIFYLAQQGFSECVMMSLIILIGFGWYLLFINHDDFDIFLTLIALMSCLNIILNILNIVNDDSYQKFHMYDSIPSIIQTAFRIIALFCLIGGIKLIWKKLNQIRQQFMVKFTIFGTIYILSLPITLIIVLYVDTIKRASFVVILSECLQLFSATLMVYLTTFQGSSFNKINIINTTFLPVEQNQKYF